MKQFFPKDVKFISLLRHPISQIESTFHYQEYDKLFLRIGLNYTSSTSNSSLSSTNSTINNGNSTTNNSSVFEEFFKAPMHYYQKALYRDASLPLLHNGMFFDLGYNFFNQTTYPDVEIYKAIKQLDDDLDLVLITEYFDESLVLLMREYCWTFDDIIYIKHNQRAHKKKHITQNAKLQREILKWNHADFLLYQHFNRTLWQRIQKQGDGFWTDFRFFKDKLANFKMRCAFQKSIQGANQKENVKFVGQQMGDRVSSFDRPLCERAALSEIGYIKRLRRHYSVKRVQKQRWRMKLLHDLIEQDDEEERKLTKRSKLEKRKLKRKQKTRSQHDIFESEPMLEQWKHNMNSIPSGERMNSVPVEYL